MPGTPTAASPTPMTDFLEDPDAPPTYVEDRRKQLAASAGIAVPEGAGEAAPIDAAPISSIAPINTMPISLVPQVDASPIYLVPPIDAMPVSSKLLIDTTPISSKLLIDAVGDDQLDVGGAEMGCAWMWCDKRCVMNDWRRFDGW